MNTRTKILLGAGVALTPCGGMFVAAAMFMFLAGGGSASGASAYGGTGTGLRSGTVPAQYEALVLQAGSQCAAAPPSIIAAQLEAESGFNPNAVSEAGAEGIAQFMPTTWVHWAQPPDASPFDPTAAIPAQGRYDCALAAAMSAAQQAGRLPSTIPVTSLMLAAYNAGAGSVLAAHGIPDNGQTPSYVSKITTRAAYYADSTGVVDVDDGSGLGARIVALAQDRIGIPYAWAGGNATGPTLGVCVPGPAANDCNIVGFDCSGLVLYVIAQATDMAIVLPHSADQQTRDGRATAITDPTQLQPGDIISFTDPGASIAHHVGIYIGGMQMIDAPDSGASVRIDSLTTSYYRSQQWRMVRFAQPS